MKETMKATSLLGVFVLAKLLVLAGRDVALSVWTPWAYLWQDVLVALLFAGLGHATAPPAVGRLGRLRPARALHGGRTCPVACTLATPLTWPLLRATARHARRLHRPPRHGRQRGSPGAVLAAAAVLPFALHAGRRRSISPRVRAAPGRRRPSSACRWARWRPRG